MKMQKKFLTSESLRCYAESLKTVNTAFTPRQSVFFMPMARTRAENNQYQPKHLFTAFSESAPLSYLTAKILKKVNKMTNTVISALWQSYQALKSIKTVDDRVHSEEAVDAVFYAMEAVETAISKCTAETPEDKAIKISLLKDLFMFDHIDINSGLEKNQLTIIEQLAAE